MMQSYSIIIHYAEIALKGKNQREFRRRLCDNVRLKLNRRGFKWKVYESQGMIEARVPPEDSALPLNEVMTELAKVFGVSWLSRAVRLQRKPEESAEAHMELARNCLLEEARAQYVPDKSFVVRVNRADKRLPFTSASFERELGGFLIEHTPWRKVSLRQPDITFNLDFRAEGTYLFSHRVRGPGGLPVGSSGRVLALLSGGIDSPVAAWLMAKRGCRVDFIHFAASSMQPEEVQEYKVTPLAQIVSNYTLQSRLFLVPYTYFDLAMMRTEVDYELVLFRRFMMRVAERLAQRLRAEALVTGDNLAQVASQTLSNLASTTRAVSMPILRPLISFDKEEIMDLARRIGTYEASIEPYKDCCAMIARHPRTRSRHDRLTAIEARVLPDYDKLVEQTLGDAVCVEIPRPARKAD
jgi:tRNA uracil 4-sulfurtransferase